MIYTVIVNDAIPRICTLLSTCHLLLLPTHHLLEHGGGLIVLQQCSHSIEPAARPPSLGLSFMAYYYIYFIISIYYIIFLYVLCISDRFS